jgi:hypothetical protein
MIKEAQDNENMLSEWEHDFINSLADKDEDYTLSEKQNAVLLRINNKVITG